MKRHLTHHWHLPHYQVPSKYENMVYGIVLAVAVPVLFVGTQLVVQTLFSLIH